MLIWILLYADRYTINIKNKKKNNQNVFFNSSLPIKENAFCFAGANIDTLFHVLLLLLLLFLSLLSLLLLLLYYTSTQTAIKPYFLLYSIHIFSPFHNYSTVLSLCGSSLALSVWLPLFRFPLSDLQYSCL